MEPMTPQDASQAHPTVPRAVLVAMAGLFGLLLAVALALWAHYGKAVFFEMILAGLAACF